MSRIVTLAVGVMVACLLIYPQAGISQYHFIRCPQNPVMPVGSPGSWDSRYVADPCVLYRDGHYNMWYSGWSGSGQLAIGFARSNDGVHWSRYSWNPVLDGNVVGWTLGGIRNAAVAWIDSQYVMLFMMYPNGAGPMARVGIAASREGIAWHVYPDPVLECGEAGTWDSEYIGFCSSIIEYRGRFWTWYTGMGPHCWAIGAATSPDLIHWTKYANNPVLIHGLPSEWDGVNLQAPEVYIRGGKLEMWYLGWPNSSQSNSAFGLAFSDDGIHWQKFQDNPVFVTGNPGQWDDRYVSSPTVVHEQDSVKLWYVAYSYSSPWSTQWNAGYAISAYPLTDEQSGYRQNFETVEPCLKTRGPNPFTNTVEFDVLSPGSGDSRISIYNVLGQKVRELPIDVFPGTSSRISWDGKDSNGQTVGNGMYFVQMRSNGSVHVQKVLRVNQ